MSCVFYVGVAHAKDGIESMSGGGGRQEAEIYAGDDEGDDERKNDDDDDVDDVDHNDGDEGEGDGDGDGIDVNFAYRVGYVAKELECDVQLVLPLPLEHVPNCIDMRHRLDNV